MYETKGNGSQYVPLVQEKQPTMANIVLMYKTQRDESQYALLMYERQTIVVNMDVCDGAKYQDEEEMILKIIIIV